jgi:hypothetical protein
MFEGIAHGTTETKRGQNRTAENSVPWAFIRDQSDKEMPPLSDEVDNLYRPPASSLNDCKEGSGAIWRRKNLLVMQEDAILPQRCYCCGQVPTPITLTLRARWHHPWMVFALIAVMFLPIVGWLLFLLGVLFLLVMGIRRHSRVEYALCARHHRRQTAVAVIAMLMMGASLLLSYGVVSGWQLASGDLERQGLLILALVMLVMGAMVGVIGRSMQRPRVRRYTGEVIWLSGFGRPFLDQFKEYQGDR